ncbi:hypothetical protein D3C85_1578810 [compost metagenome]
MGMKGLDLAQLGVPTEQAYLSRYYAKAPLSGRVRPFHYAFALFRLSVIFQGIAARGRPGASASIGSAANSKLSADFARLAIRAAQS